MQIIRYLSIFLLWPVFVFSKPLVLATFPIPLMVESPEKGLFVTLTKEIAKRNERELKILILPIGKTLLDFSNNKVDGFFPALDAYVPTLASKSIPFYRKVDYIFSRTGSPLKTLKDLEGKRVGLTFRYPYGKELLANKKIKFELADDDIHNMKKLARGTIDAFIAEERSGLKALQVSGEKGISFDKKWPLSEQVVYYAFQNTDEGRVLAEIFSKTIEVMRKDGSLEKALTE